MKRFFNLFLFLVICIVGMAQVSRTVEVKKPGTLSELLTDEEKASITELTLVGKLNSADVSILRRMAGAKDKWTKYNWEGKLISLDLSNANFVKDNTPYYVSRTTPDYYISVNRSYSVYSNSGISMSRSQYMRELEDNQNHGASNILASRDPARKLSKIEQLQEGPQTFLLRDVDDNKWKEIKRNGWNTFEDYYVEKADGDSAFYQ